MSDASVHIGAWEAAGLIDRATADRLRAATAAASDDADRPRSTVAEVFGPSVTIPEVFGYLGAAFLLGAASFTIGRSTADGAVDAGALSIVVGAALVAIGLFLRRGDARRSRAAGVAFVVATGYISAGAYAALSESALSFATSATVAAGIGLVTAIALRRVHPGLLTQVGVLAWIVLLAQAVLALLDERVFQTAGGNPTGTVPDPVLLVVLSAGFWLVVAVLIGLIGLTEARTGNRTGSRAAYRRAGLTRLWAGITAVTGLATAVMRSGPKPDDGYGRVIEPIVGEVALLVLAAVLVERAFRRGATSFIYAAALALIVALTDFNVSYVSGTTEVALLVEGVILLGVGVVANRLRRRIGNDDVTDAPGDGGDAAAAVPAPAAAEPALDAGPAG